MKRLDDTDDLLLAIAARLLIHGLSAGRVLTAEEALSKARKHLLVEADPLEDLPGVCRTAVENWLPELSAATPDASVLERVVAQLRCLNSTGLPREV